MAARVAAVAKAWSGVWNHLYSSLAGSCERPEHTAGDSANEGELQHVLERRRYVATLVWEARMVDRAIGDAERGTAQEANAREKEDPARRNLAPNHGGIGGDLASESGG